MGQQHSSLVYSSKPKDVLRNLEWSLQENYHWEQQAQEAKLLLLNSGRMNQQRQGLGGLDLANAEMYEARKVQIEATTAMLKPINGTKKRRSYLSELENSTFPMNTQVALGQSASEIFAVGAAAQIAQNQQQNNNTMTDMNQGMRQMSLHGNNELGQQQQQQSQNPFDDEDLDTQRRFGGRRNLPMQGSTKDITSSLGTEVSAQREETERKNCIAKFLFINQLLSKCQQNSAHNYKLNLLNNDLRQHHDERTPTSTSMTQEHYRNSPRSNQLRVYEQQLLNSLANFDRARATYHWAARDYELSLALYKVDNMLRRLQLTGAALHSLDDSTRAPTILQLETSIKDLQRTKNQLYNAIHRNDRNALNLGFNYLDSNQSGELETTHLQGMNTRLLRLLNVNQSNRLTSKNLQYAIDQQSKIVEKDLNRIRDLQFHNTKLMAGNSSRNEQTLHHNQQEINRLTLESQQASNDLGELYDFFLQAFSRHVFNQLDTQELRNNELDYNTLMNELKNVEMKDSLNMNNPASPLVAQKLQKEASLNLHQQHFPEAAVLLQQEQQQQQPQMIQGLQQQGSSRMMLDNTSNNSLLQTQPVAVGGMEMMNNNSNMNQEMPYQPLQQQLQQQHQFQQQPSAGLSNNELSNVTIPTGGQMQNNNLQQQPLLGNNSNMMNMQQYGQQQQQHNLGGLPTVDQQSEVQNIIHGRHTRSNSGFKAHEQPPLPHTPGDNTTHESAGTQTPTQHTGGGIIDAITGLFNKQTTTNDTTIDKERTVYGTTS